VVAVNELNKALRFIDEAGKELDRIRVEPGDPIDRLTVHDESEAERVSGRGQALMRLAEDIDIAALPVDLGITVKVGQSMAARWAKAARWWWLVHDPMGVGFHGMFGPTPYCGGMALSNLAEAISRQAFDRQGDLDRYLGLVSDLAQIVRSMETRLKGQADRGIVMPAVQLAQAKALVPNLAGSVAARLRPSREALAGIEGPERFLAELQRRISGEIAPAFTSLASYLDGDYGSRAGDDVGLSQYAGGREVYEELVSHHLTFDMTSEEVHAEGDRRMTEVRGQMAALRSEIGFDGDDAAFLSAMGHDPRWRADTPDGIADMFRRYAARFAPHVETLFRFGPKGGYDARPLPEALSGAMTFGYYQVPTTPGGDGHYLFNARNLSKAPLGNVAALNYHELVPGHHFHMASQIENESIPRLQKRAFYNAFNEGWAEYAATLAGEVGCYAEPEERFGRLMMDAFLTTRLVVDTGMNAFGWSLEKARDYMRANSFMSETEIRTESIRYSCDIPGQSLAYKLGDTFLLRQRDRMKVALGDRFDIRDFHDAVLRPGALPLPLVGENVDRAIAALAEG
jgi:uncharacterized protein (DUF885 family)